MAAGLKRRPWLESRVFSNEKEELRVHFQFEIKPSGAMLKPKADQDLPSSVKDCWWDIA